MLLIADSGSTKTSWCLVGANNDLRRYTTEGYNPFFVKPGQVEISVRDAFSADVDLLAVEVVEFYGAGCMGKQIDVMRESLGRVFSNAVVNVHMDLLAAARGLLERKAGFAAILGTGTNTCLYDGTSIAHHIDSLGFILGDEGSGSAIGGRLLGDYIRGFMPLEVREKFYEFYRLSPDEIMNRVYGQPHASRYCAGFTRFLTQENLADTYLSDIVRNAFALFFKNIVSRYPEYREFTFNCVGSVGFAFRDILEEVATEFGMRTGKIVSSPMPGLVRYHRGKTAVLTFD